MPKISIKNLSHAFERDKLILKDINIEILEGQFTCIIGPSGSGKSTLMHLMSGILKSKNQKHFYDEHSSRIAIVFQKHNLFPWKTVRDNVSIALEKIEKDKRIKNQIIDHYLDEVGLLSHHEKFPHQLSEGMKQRVGIARAFATTPDILFMDEPFGSLDALTRSKMQKLLKEIWKKRHPTVVFITHDIEEALLLGDRIIVLGREPTEIIRDFDLKKNNDCNNEELKKEIIDLLG